MNNHKALRYPRAIRTNTPVYEVFDNTATVENIVYNKGGDHFQNGGYRTQGKGDGIQCIWNCPYCKKAMRIGKRVKIAFDNVLCVPLTCDNDKCPSKMKEPEDATL